MSLKYPCFLKSSSFSTRVELKSKDQRTLCSLSQNQKKNETSHSVIHSFHVHRCFKVVLCNLVCAIPLACAKLESARAPSLNKQTNKGTSTSRGIIKSTQLHVDYGVTFASDRQKGFKYQHATMIVGKSAR